MTTQLRRLIEAATSQPWETSDRHRRILHPESPGAKDGKSVADMRYINGDNDAQLIVWCRNHAEDIAALIEAAQVLVDDHDETGGHGCAHEPDLRAALVAFEEAGSDRALREAAS